MAEPAVEPIGRERAIIAVEKVKERLRRATSALDEASVLYAVVGGNAVAEWVARIDEDAVRNTPNVDLLIRRPDFPAARACLEAVGFSTSNSSTSTLSLTGRKGNRAARSTSSTPVRKSKGRRLQFTRNRRIGTSHRISVVRLEALLIMQLTSYRLIDKVHLRDMISSALLTRTGRPAFTSAR